MRCCDTTGHFPLLLLLSNIDNLIIVPLTSIVHRKLRTCLSVPSSHRGMWATRGHLAYNKYVHYHNLSQRSTAC
jgi:hypothetical protein